MKIKMLSLFMMLCSSLMTSAVFAADLKIGDPAPLFTGKTQDNKDFSLASRKGQWTVLYFYPKAGTPGCTTQACAFRDSIEKIHAQGAEVYGVSADTVKDQADFHEKHHLNFALIADPDDKIVDLYGTKMPMLKFSKRWTFILDPDLKIRMVEKDVDPALDADKVAKQIADMKSPSNTAAKVQK